MSKPSRPVYRIEAPGEHAVPYPTLAIAMSVDPQGSEATIATSLDGVVLAEATPWELGYLWQPTNAGADVLRGHVAGMRCAS